MLTALAPTMRLAVAGVALSPLQAVLLLTPLASAVRDAVFRIASS
jgi:hypothetical protein